MNTVELKEIARNIRMTVIEAVHAAGSGHPGGSLSQVVLFLRLI